MGDALLFLSPFQSFSGSLAQLSLPLSVVWVARWKFKDPPNTWRLSQGVFLAGAFVLLLTGWRGREARWAGRSLLFEDCSTNKPGILHPPPHALLLLKQQQTFPTSFK